MIFPILYWVVFPILAGVFVIRWLNKHAPSRVTPEALELMARAPIEKKWFRAARRDHKGVASLGDFEKQIEAVDAAYAGKEKAQAAGEKASFLVFNDQGELLEQVDS